MELSKGQYVRRGNSYHHNQCGGQLMIDAVGKRSLPLGFGFRGGKFVIDSIKQNVCRGVCLKCSTGGLFIEQGRGKLSTKYPRHINRLIK